MPGRDTIEEWRPTRAAPSHSRGRPLGAPAPLITMSPRRVNAMATQVDPASVWCSMVAGLASVTQAILGSGITRDPSAEVRARPHVSTRHRSTSRARSRSPSSARRTTIVSRSARSTQVRDARLPDTAGTSRVLPQQLLAVASGSLAAWRLYRSCSTGQLFWYKHIGEQLDATLAGTHSCIRGTPALVGPLRDVHNYMQDLLQDHHSLQTNVQDPHAKLPLIPVDQSTDTNSTGATAQQVPRRVLEGSMLKTTGGLLVLSLNRTTCWWVVSRARSHTMQNQQSRFTEQRQAVGQARHELALHGFVPVGGVSRPGQLPLTRTRSILSPGRLGVFSLCVAQTRRQRQAAGVAASASAEQPIDPVQPTAVEHPHGPQDVTERARADPILIDSTEAHELDPVLTQEEGNKSSSHSEHLTQ